MSINGYHANVYSTNGLSTINADVIQSTSISCDTFLDQSSSLFTGVSSNLQNQINSISGIISSGGGGYFSIYATQNTGFSTSLRYWGYSSGSNLSVNVPLIFSYGFKVTSITFSWQTTPTTAGIVQLYKNNTNVYEMTSITSSGANNNLNYITFNDINVVFDAAVVI